MDLPPEDRNLQRGRCTSGFHPLLARRTHLRYLPMFQPVYVGLAQRGVQRDLAYIIVGHLNE